MHLLGDGTNRHQQKTTIRIFNVWKRETKSFVLTILYRINAKKRVSMHKNTEKYTQNTENAKYSFILKYVEKCTEASYLFSYYE